MEADLVKFWIKHTKESHISSLIITSDQSCEAKLINVTIAQSLYCFAVTESLTAIKSPLILWYIVTFVSTEDPGMMNIPTEVSDKIMVLSETDDSICSEPLSTVHNKSLFSFHIPNVSNINPFHVSFRPTCVSTPRKSHHVSMPTQLYKPIKLMSVHNTRSLGKIKDFKARPFSIKVESCNAGNNVTKCETFKKPKAGRRSLALQQPRRTRAKRMKRNGVFWMRICSIKMRMRLSCVSVQETEKNTTLIRRRKHYFL